MELDRNPTPISYIRGRGLRSYQAQAAGGPEGLWLVGKELLVPWLPFPGSSFQVPPVQTNVAQCLCSLVKSCYCPGSLGAPVLPLRDRGGHCQEHHAQSTTVPSSGTWLSVSLDLLCDLRQTACPLRVSQLPHGFFIAQAGLELESLPTPTSPNTGITGKCHSLR